MDQTDDLFYQKVVVDLRGSHVFVNNQELIFYPTIQLVKQVHILIFYLQYNSQNWICN